MLTESWLRESDFHISPTKADYVSICGLEVFRRFKALNPEMGFARNMGVIVNMKDSHSATDEDYHAWLRSDPDNRCFTQAVPRMNSLQDAARFQVAERSYAAKYPGTVGNSIRALADEVVQRMNEANLPAAESAPATQAPAA